MAIKKIKLPDNTTVDINDSRLPAVTTTDNGKVLSVSEGIWSANSKPSYTLDEVSDGSTRKLSDYVTISGGQAISGAKTFTGNVCLNGTNPNLIFRNSGGLFGRLYMKAVDGPFYRVDSTWAHEYQIYDAGNANKSDVAWTTGALTTNGNVTFYNTSSHTYRINANFSSAVARFYACNDAATSMCDIMFGSPTTANSLYYQGTTGNVGIGTSTPSEKAHVIGNILASGTITPGSDSRIKDKQKDISSEKAFSVIENLKPKTWVWNEKSNENLNGKSAAGLVAQEVKEILPDAVSISENGDIKDFHSLNYNTIQGYEIAAIKGLIEEVKSLKAEITELKKQIK